MTRTDIHRPSAIIPADYQFIVFRYIGPNPSEEMHNSGWRAIMEAHRAKTGGKYSNHEHGGTCCVCGAGAMYLAIFYHAKTNTYLKVGETCADKMDFSAEGFSLFRKAAKAEAGRIAGKVKAQQTLATTDDAALWDIWSANHAATVDVPREEGIIVEMVNKLIKYGSISEKQLAFARTLAERIAGRAALKAQRAAENASSAFVGAVGDRRDFDLTCQWFKTFETAYGMLTVHGFKDAAGNVVIYKGQKIAEKGETVSLKATVKAHEDRDGTKQTIINRPKIKAEA
jgi:hypothetical protein